jgi:lysophospholipase L1-like esterase
MIKNIKWLLLLIIATAACNDNDDTTITTISSGDADFSTYVALGDSFAAGYSDGALFALAQETSYANILAIQLKEAGGGDFGIPYMNDNLGGLLYAGTQIATTRLYYDGVGVEYVSGTPTTEVTTKLSGSYNNYGIPGAKSYHLIYSGYGDPSNVLAGTSSPYFSRFSSSATTTVLADAFAKNPTFFSLWIGGNDALGYATTGGDGSDAITTTAAFEVAYTTLLTTMTSNGAKGVVANLPYVSNLPYFTTVPYNPVTLTADQVSSLNEAFASYNSALTSAVEGLGLSQEEADSRKVVFVEGTNPVIIVDSYLTDLTTYSIPSYRPATSEDYMLLTSSAFIGTLVDDNESYVNGVSVPLADKWVLSKDEAAELKTAIDDYNAIIENAANTYGLAFVDAKTIMEGLTSDSGISSNGITIKDDYITGGGFSLDGIHPSPRGYALIANYFIDAINTKYGSNLIKVDVGDYGVLFQSSL